VHPPSVRAAVLALVAAGLNDCEISRRIGVPRRTVSDMRRRPYVRKTIVEVCPRCWRPARPLRFTPGDYAELLGLYLGDGCISQHSRTARLRIALDAKYERMNKEIQGLLRRCFPANPIGVVQAHGGTMIVLSAYSGHMACLFPQDGDGPKHLRSVKLERWQSELVKRAPWPCLRGLVRSDGCSFINRTGPYEYLSYDFTNKSDDIVDLFTYACELVGVDYRRTIYRGAWKVRVNRRRSVALMLDNVGLKE
jgi:Homeodomain-like domain-containing protein